MIHCNKIQNVLSAEVAAIESEKIWYLLHFAVTNPNKPGKFKLVFDATPKSQGMSFDDAFLAGPDLVNSLVSVLLKFHQKNVGFCGDKWVVEI